MTTQRQFALLLVWLLLAFGGKLAAAPMRVERDVRYTDSTDQRQTLDVYAPAEGENHPVVVWIHGGGWRQGNKSGVQQKPAALVERGYVFVSINYRLVPQVTLTEMMGDVAAAIRWTYQNSRNYGGDSDSIVVMGHSAGAHLAALVCTDNRYLKNEGLTLSILRGCVPVDVSVYDIPKRLSDGGSVPNERFAAVFGSTEASHRELSPATHVEAGKSIPPFLILHVADRADTKVQSEWFAEKLREAGVSATVVAAEGKTHASISADLGRPDDPPTLALWQFLDSVRSPTAAR